MKKDSTKCRKSSVGSSCSKSQQNQTPLEELTEPEPRATPREPTRGKLMKSQEDLHNKKKPFPNIDSETMGSSCSVINGVRKKLHKMGRVKYDFCKHALKKNMDAAAKGKSHRKLDNPEKDKQKIKDGRSAKEQNAEFEAKYVQLDQLGEGGCGSVFAGYRRSDNLQVAIKHIPKCNAPVKLHDESGRLLYMEVAVMLKLKDEALHTFDKASPVALLDWYDVPKELILVMERPIPAMDMLDFIESKGGTLQEDETKIIMKQLIKTAIDLKDKNIFHRDIKIENILIETSSDVPRARLIDFGVSCVTTERSRYRVFTGTPNHVPPELLTSRRYRAGPTTVWQLGVVMFETFNKSENFTTKKFIKKNLKIREDLSEHCQDFLRACLNTFPEKRPKLKDLMSHSWLK
ncbi:serine/threonine-protein kinase pim-1 [Oryzias melastigma]|uniref:non-specific serine/threonine protein kinase n=1 Tax=Oryzias melastigma TaxID=30732 RepID=A0A3B3DXN5_ORYME|nr:serine/threonine-protein kinase pim-1 [Oryzias melastigma]